MHTLGILLFSCDSILMLFILFCFYVELKVGDRCQVEPGEKRGVVKFVGQAETLRPGFWVGVQYDEPVGKHDGSYVILNPITCSMIFQTT